MGKFIFFATHPFWTSHLETELELMQNHLDAGGQVVQVVCNTELLPCDQNMKAEANKCLRCINRRHEGVKLLTGGGVAKVRFGHLSPKQDFVFHDLESLKQIEYKGFDLGYAVASSFLSLERLTDIDLASHGARLQQMLQQSAGLFNWAKKFIQEQQPAAIYLFNGRLFQTRPLLRAAQQLGVEARIHERGQSLAHYSIYYNHLPHDIAAVGERIRQAWARPELSVAEKEAIATEWYTRRRQGEVQAWKSFVAGQEAGSLPPGFDASLTNVAIFNSSEDEYASIGTDWRRFLPDTQQGTVERLALEFRDKPYHFYLRCHPNLGPAEVALMQHLAAKGIPNLTVILPDSKLSTYALMEACAMSVSFGSTMGMESCFWGKPSISLASSFYYAFEGTYNPKSFDELFTLVARPPLPKGKEVALMYGYYLQTFGLPFKYYQADGLGKGSFKGVDLSKQPLPVVSRFIRKLPKPLAPTLIRHLIKS